MIEIYIHDFPMTVNIGLKRKKESEVAQLCLTLCDPWTVAYQAPPSMGFSRQEYWSGLPFPSLGDLPNPGLPHCRQMLYRLSRRELHWQVSTNPPQDFCHKSYEVTAEPQSRASHLLRTGHVILSHKHTVELVKYSGKHVL